MRIERLMIGTLMACGISFALEARAESAPDFRQDVAPILMKYCAGCHNAEDREGDYSVENFADFQKGAESGETFVAKKSRESLLIQLITGAKEPKMPPEDNEAPTADEIAVIKAWIDAGATPPEEAAPMPTLVTPRIAAAPVAPPITATEASPDGNRLAVALYQRVELRDRETGSVLATLGGFPGKVNAVHFNTSGDRLLTASGVTGLYGEAVLWDVAGGTPLRTFRGHRDVLYDAELSPDGKWVATCSYDQKIQLWDAESGKDVRVLEGHNDAVYDLAFSPDSTLLATASGDETVKIWQVESGRRLDTLSQPQGEQYVVAFSPDGRFVLAGGADNRIRVWRLLSTERPRINPLRYSRFAHEGAVTGLSFSDDGKLLVSVAEDRTLKLWETRRYTQIRLYNEQPDQVTALANLPGKETFLAARIDGSLEAYPLAPAENTDNQVASTEVEAVPMPVDASLNRLAEHEPNDNPQSAMKIYLPATISGVMHNEDTSLTDQDLYRFESKAGQEWVFEINAARQKSPLDSKLEVLDAAGKPVERVLLRALRDSYFTFRGKDSATSDDFRVHNWQEMEINEFLYANGEVVKLWHYPRGPDSGFQVYPGRGSRYTYFDTTAMSHALHQPCYVVEPHPPGTVFLPNGLPTFTLYYENDDDSRRELESDSRLTFRAPHDGEYLIRVTDTRSFEGPEYKYDLSIRARQPDFEVTIGGQNPAIEPGSGKEFSLDLKRKDGFEGDVEVTVEGLPPGFHVSSPIIVESGQTLALATIYARQDAMAPTEENAKSTRLIAKAEINGKTVTREVGSLGEIKLNEKSKLRVRVVTKDSEQEFQQVSTEKPLELTVAPGETLEAKVIIERDGFDGRVSFGNADAGRNLPHGVFVDNIGLNGLLIVEGQSQRNFFITAAPWVPETSRLFHLRAEAEGNPTSLPVLLHVEELQSAK